MTDSTVNLDGIEEGLPLVYFNSALVVERWQW